MIQIALRVYKLDRGVSESIPTVESEGEGYRVDA